jgi:hypothetical protein
MKKKQLDALASRVRDAKDQFILIYGERRSMAYYTASTRFARGSAQVRLRRVRSSAFKEKKARYTAQAFKGISI